MKQRCDWVGMDPLMTKYHDEEWGKPVHDDRKMFEFLVLEAFQAGLSWRTVLNKRENFRKAFSNFDFNKVAKYTSKDVNRLLKDAGIIRNRMKIEATINNAKKVIEVRKEFGTFSSYMWSFIKKPITNYYRKLKDYRAKTELSDTISEDMRKRGFKFVGSTVIYSHMQATGMVDDHMVHCFRKRARK